jgi:ABC-type nitrate/sulfonate/bicarbonate transport system substrate-binding protein
MQRLLFPMQIVRIRLLWHPQAQFAGYHLAQSLNLARDAGIDIECQPIKFDQPAIANLLSGDVEFAVASPSHLLESKRPEDLKFLLTIQQESSLVYPVKTTSGINEVADLSGHRVGVWPGHEDLELRWMLLKAGITDDAVERVPLANTVDAFIAGTVDCAQMTTYHELHKAEDVLGHGNLRTFSAATFSASLIKDGLVASRKWLESNRERAQAVVNAILQGWTLAFTKPELAVDACIKFRPDMSRAEHAAQLRGIKQLSLCGATGVHGLGYPDSLHIRRCLQAMRDLSLGEKNVSDSELIDMRFWQNAPAQWRSKDWHQE